MTDPIADMLTRIRNASAAGKSEVVLPYSKLKHRIADILMSEGYLETVERLSDHFGSLRLVIKYTQGEPAVGAIRRISTPGRRVYAGATELPRVKSDIGIAIISTSVGIMTNKEARKRKLGGEVLCEVY